jgi:hypothetical protein
VDPSGHGKPLKRLGATQHDGDVTSGRHTTVMYPSGNLHSLEGAVFAFSNSDLVLHWGVDTGL